MPVNRIFPENQVNYVLRMYLPPWNREKILEEIVRFCRETGTEYVLLFTDAQHMVWNQLTIDEAKKEAENIAFAVRELKKYGIHTGINSSYNMTMSRFDHSKHNPQYRHWATMADGVSEKRSPCLLDPALKDYLSEFYGILAGTGAEFLFIDDDNRYILDGRRNTWGCMCDLHISEFSALTGKTYTRETLQEAIFHDPDARRRWIAFLKKGLEDIVRTIGNAVRKIAPDMPIGIMVPSLHATVTNGYDLKKTARLLQPEGPLIMRPCIGAYTDKDRSIVMPGLFYMEQVGSIMGEDVQYTPEIETTPFTRFSESMRVVSFHIFQGILNRMPNPLISACGYVGNGPYFEPEIAVMLRRKKPYFDSLLKLAPRYGTRRGIGLKYHPNSAADTPNNWRNVTDFYHPAFAVHDFLSNSGFCTTFDDSGVTLLAGDSVYSFPDEQLKAMLKRNLILDAVAVKAFADRGYGEFLGVKTGEMTAPFGAEYFEDPEFCGKYAGTYAPLKMVPLNDVWKLEITNPETRELSCITDHDLNRVSPAMTLFRNDLGGKISAMCYRIGPMTVDMRHLINYQKQTLMRNILTFMDPSTVPLFVEKPSCFAVQYFDDGRNALAVITNLSYDSADEITVTLEDASLDPEKGTYLGTDGVSVPLAEIIAAEGGKQCPEKNRNIFSMLIWTSFRSFPTHRRNRSGGAVNFTQGVPMTASELSSVLRNSLRIPSENTPRQPFSPWMKSRAAAQRKQ